MNIDDSVYLDVDVGVGTGEGRNNYVGVFSGLGDEVVSGDGGLV